MTGLHAGLRALILVAGLLPLLAQAYSGAGGECGNSALEAAALRGTPLELEQALDKGVQNIEKVVDQWSGDIARLYPDTSRVWLNREVRRSGREAKRQTFARWWSGCRGIRLLDAAVAGQNLANVRYLLALGVDPNAPDAQGTTLLMRCPHLEPGNPQIFTHSAPRSRSPDALGARQASCHLSHAAKGCLFVLPIAMATTDSRSGLSVTGPAGDQFRVWRDQRAGWRSRASTYSA